MLAYPMLAYFLMTVTTPSAVSLMMLDGLWGLCSCRLVSQT